VERSSATTIESIIIEEVQLDVLQCLVLEDAFFGHMGWALNRGEEIRVNVRILVFRSS
jgi:hypothetical protein